MVADCFQTATAAGIKVDVVVDIGLPANHILSRAVDLPASMIVMGTHGAGGFERFLLGSVAEKVLRKATCPVLTVPPRPHATSTLPFKRVLCAVDFSESSLKGLEFAFSLAQESGATLTILHVVEWPWGEPPSRLEPPPPHHATALSEYRLYLEQSATGRLNALVPAAVQDRCPTTARLEHGRSWEEILRVAELEKTDLIVVGIHGRNALDLTLFGSTTNHVVRRSTCPVLTLRR
jgi:nucleotide-binding universal stress UspA family protein